MDTPRGRDGERPRARNIGNVEAEPHVEGHGRIPQVVQPISPVVEVVDRLLLLKLTQVVKKLGVVPFLGGTDYFVAKTWICNMIGYFKLVACTEIEKVQISISFLHEEARQWWDSVERIISYDVLTIVWVEFKGIFVEKYFPSFVRKKLKVEFRELNQGTMSARYYDARFAFLYQFVQPMDPISLTQKFERGLNSRIQRVVAPLRLCTVADVLESAVAVEEDIVAYKEQAALKDTHGKGKAIAESSNEGRDQGRFWKRQKTNQQTLIRAEPIRQVAHVTCFNCHEVGHTSRHCTKPKNRICFNCRQGGHKHRDCTQPRRDGQEDQLRQQAQGQQQGGGLARVLAIEQGDNVNP